MGSPLGPVLAGIYMVEFELKLMTTLNSHLHTWYDFVDDTFCFINCQSADYVLPIFNDFHPHIQFMYEVEHLGKLNFLDVQLICNRQQFETKVHRKQQNTDKYMHWDSFAPIQCKRSTLSTIVHHVVPVKDIWMNSITSVKYFTE